MPTISVIIPAYNAEKTILETIYSVQKQTFLDFELIIVNDGSKDKTLEILHSVKDERLKIFSYENKGQAVARNRGISHATGEFLSFLDADDLWSSDKLELQLAALQQHPEAGVAYSWTYFMDEQGKSFHPGETIFYEGNVYVQMLLRNFLDSGSNPLIRRQAIESVGEFDPSVTGVEDWDYWLRLAACWPFVVVPKHQIFYRQSSSSFSSKIKIMEERQLKVIEQAFQSAPKELQSLKPQSLANVYKYLVEKCLLQTTHSSTTNDHDQLKLAGYMLQKLILAYPKALVEKQYQNIMKWFIKLLMQRSLFVVDR